MQQRRRRRFACTLADVVPQPAQVLHVVGQLVFVRVLGDGADDVPAALLGRNELLQPLAQILALGFVFDALRDADVRILRQVHQHPSGEAHLRRQPRAFGADRILHHLHDDRLPFGEDLLDRARIAAVLPRFPDVGDVQERRALQADLDEGRLHARQHPRDHAAIDIAHQSAPVRTLDVQFLRHARVDDGDARFLRRDVDQNVFGHVDVDCAQRARAGFSSRSGATTPRFHTAAGRRCRSSCLRLPG